MMPVADVLARENSLIVDGRYMVCPRCKRQQDILLYVPMGQIEEFRSETVPVYKCPTCRWIFAPAHNALAEIFDSREEPPGV